MKNRKKDIIVFEFYAAELTVKIKYFINGF